jgi:hypothetical protein
MRKCGSDARCLLVYTNAPAIQAGFWVGGYQGSGTTASITDSTKKYASEMIQLNTTTGRYTSMNAPYNAVEEGSLSYLPVGDNGILVYIGGDVPSVKNGVNATMTAMSIRRS